MRTELKIKLIAYTLAPAFVFATFGRLFAGAPIPVDPHYVILNAPRIARNTGTCVPVWTRAKAYRCDTIFANGMQP